MLVLTLEVPGSLPLSWEDPFAACVPRDPVGGSRQVRRPGGETECPRPGHPATGAPSMQPRVELQDLKAKNFPASPQDGRKSEA